VNIRRSGRSSLPISAEIALPRLQSEIKVVFLQVAPYPRVMGFRAIIDFLI